MAGQCRCQVLKCPRQRPSSTKRWQQKWFRPEMCGAGFCHRLKGKTTVTGKLTNPATTKGQSSEPVDKAKARMLKVLVRLVVVLFLAEPHQ